MASIATTLVIKLNMWKGEDVRVVTFGQPRVGDIKYAECHDTVVSWQHLYNQ